MSLRRGITCAICTYNSPGTLRDAIRSLVAQDIALHEIEVLVIDNGGFPETRTIADSFSNSCSFQYRVIREVELGLSNARNRAIAEATMPVIAFLDDDAEANSHWAQRLLEAFDRSDVLAAGGPVFPKWEIKKPVWLDLGLYRSLSLV